MSLVKVKLSNFTVFENIDISLSKGINIFIGKNGTGKTHLLKMLYAACDVTKGDRNFAEKLTNVFMPQDMTIGRLVRRQNKSMEASIEVFSESGSVKAQFSNHTNKWMKATVKEKKWKDEGVESAFIPVKEMLTHAPGFRSLYNKRELFFDETYADIIDRAFLPQLRGSETPTRKKLTDILKKSLNGTVTYKNEQFYHKSRQGELEFSLLA